jgi:hypothetical protein
MWMGKLAAAADASGGGGSPDIVDATTLRGKFMFGYMGWEQAAGDGSPANKWAHWSSGGTPTSDNSSAITFDLWPDVKELGPDELFATGFHDASGNVLSLYSNYVSATTQRHVKWLKDYHLDGLFVQRFLARLNLGDADRQTMDHVLNDVATASRKYGRVFAIRYDLAGAPAVDKQGRNPAEQIENDWMHLVDDLKITDNDRYLNHKGRPVIAITGLGYKANVNVRPEHGNELLKWFHGGAPPQYRATIIGVVSTGWRTRSRDSQPDPQWTSVYHGMDVLMPWSVNRYQTMSQAKRWFEENTAPDMDEAARLHIDYMPVIFPGYSDYHRTLHTAAKTGGDTDHTLNQVPRLGGRFWWAQAQEISALKCNMVFGAMFDEMDESTAIFKLANSTEAPAEMKFVTVDADGADLPDDWYLRLARESARMFRGEISMRDPCPTPDKLTR